MILGIGSDLCDVRRIEEVLNRHGKRFTQRIFTPNEIKKAEARYGKTRIGTYAKRWAAKEACAKALGTGFTEDVFYQDIEVINLPSGKPSLKLTNGALKQLNKLGKEGYEPNILLTMTDELPYAFAQVMIELLPSKE
ncbi:MULTISPECIES: holo-ACP synthase [Commensalibacter]|uniref:Holo-[acyl-carrier-protein] synthase n=2 Tax=Commensalibacter TaxID=1079922 RepID=W7E1M0_9PROT|nr:MULTISPECIES: holo-ACP synthase [Commensalibacter]EUK18984.1 4'-phosphopantetheinyl transferase [Commensalibacter papalotli (ex Servin-Garciduenas et al. 2014)]CAI3924637.1 Phosphopantetheinyl transferase (holo-ACP synthase) (AcpS) (PDB:1F7L) [Commensalibacter papalotli (ex Botero et al. 2024)]CAI3927415.1 Phosphopantetheinyl transferase (holo-ACP synthase) (AcpS) (PDB:1F7L) [Commensalibacter papalotli (ex Botero et al. 2024)]